MDQRGFICLLVGWFLMLTLSAHALIDTKETTVNVKLEENPITSTDSGFMEIIANFMGSQFIMKICVVDSTHTHKKIKRICPWFKSDSKSSIRCTIGNDRFNCLRQLTMGEADFTILEPEDLLVAVAYEEWPILVTHELRAFPKEKHAFAMTIVANKYIDYLWQLKHASLCHPGLIDVNAPDWTIAFSKYLEETSILPECDPTKTLLENRLMGLSKYFDRACIAGPWSLNMSYDREMKLKYDNLCNLCSNSQSCYVTDRHYGQEGALQCLTSGVGDVAWVRLDYVMKHIKENSINTTDYHLICPDGTPGKFSNPCVWIAKPWPVVVAKRDSAESVSRIMTDARMRTSEWHNKLLELMEDYHPIPINTDNLIMPEDFLKQFPGFSSANTRALPCEPSRRIKWCVTTNLENLKCQRMRDVASAYGIQPPISCIQKPHVNLCAEAIRHQRADVFVAKPEQLFNMRENGLKPIMRAASNKEEDLDRIVAVVKQDSSYETLVDLKNSRACFTGYRSLGWNAFVNIMNETMDSWDCSESKAVGNFFKAACTFNLDDTDKADLPSNLYSLCEKDIPWDEKRILDSIKSDTCDVSFVQFRTLKKDEDYMRNKYRILCMNETKHNDTCSLTRPSLAYVMVHENITDLRTQEIHLMLLEMNEFFGTTFQGKTPAFSLYGDYEQNPSIIFPEKTQQLIKVNENNGKKQKFNYENVIDNLVKKRSCNSASHFNRFNNLLYYLHYFIIICVIL